MLVLKVLRTVVLWDLVSRKQQPKVLGCVQQGDTRWNVWADLEYQYLNVTGLLKPGLPHLAYREVKDLVFFLKFLCDRTIVNLEKHISIIKHSRTRLNSSSSELLRPSITSQASYFNRIFKLWNFIIKNTPPTSIINILYFNDLWSPTVTVCWT